MVQARRDAIAVLNPETCLYLEKSPRSSFFLSGWSPYFVHIFEKLGGANLFFFFYQRHRSILEQNYDNLQYVISLLKISNSLSQKLQFYYFLSLQKKNDC